LNPHPALYLIPNLLGTVAPERVLAARTIECARALRHLAVETPKAARAFLATLKLPVPISALEIVEIPTAHVVEAWLRAGHNVGVISDAGCPGTADPGSALVALAHRLGVRVIPLVGPCAMLLALMASGMNGQKFKFHGYLATDKTERANQIRSIDNDVRTCATTHLFIETPYRNTAMIEAIRTNAKVGIDFCVAQNLTCDDELVVSKPIAQWSDADAARLSGKRPSIFLLGTLQRGPA
jgi:16S rRNA (cytidine1402-2'-O)-methyltransferase